MPMGYTQFAEAERDRRRLEAEEVARTTWRQRGRSCLSCKEPVVFARNKETGSWMILDAMPHWEKGNLVVSESTHNLEVEVASEEDAATRRSRGDAVFVDHHAVCPNVEQHRKKES